MSQNELSDLVRRAARDELDEILASVFLVRLPCGTEKSAIELTEKEFASVEPSMKRLWVWWWKYRHKMADRGYTHVGGGAFKHVDHLTPEDVPGLRAAREEEHGREVASVGLAGLISEGIQDLRNLGSDVGWEDDETLGDWVRKDRD